MDVLKLNGGDPANFVSFVGGPGVSLRQADAGWGVLLSFTVCSWTSEGEFRRRFLPRFPRCPGVLKPRSLSNSGATAEAVKKAFELLLTEKKVKSIFVNICESPLQTVPSLTWGLTYFLPVTVGGIMRCDVSPLRSGMGQPSLGFELIA
jgi:succinyl-CoA synthetase beta subunit